MKEIKIVGISEKGNQALKQHIKEFKKMKWKDRLIFKTAGYKHTVISETKPIAISLTANNRHVSNPMFIDLIVGEIKNALEQNGATLDTDYTVEVT